MQYDVVIVGAGIAGLACAKVLQQNNISFVIIESEDQPGGRIKTDVVDGYRLDHGFQVLQTAYPEPSRFLDIEKLQLKKFPAGAAVRYNNKFHIMADPRRHPQHIISTITSPIGTLKDRIGMLQLARSVCRGSLEELFTQPEEKTIDFLHNKGFSKEFIDRFFVPFFAGTCLDKQIIASSRVLKYIFRVFTQGDAAIPSQGMGEIPRQLASELPANTIRLNSRVVSVKANMVTLTDGTEIRGNTVVLATSQPALQNLLQLPPTGSSMGESCLYYAADWLPPFKNPFLVLNGDGRGPINNIAFPSLIAPQYAPSGKTLIAVVVLGEEYRGKADLEQQVQSQCIEWFGKAAREWDHIRTYTITHALPNQEPPTANPYEKDEPIDKHFLSCGEHSSLPGIQWALLSGRQTAETLVGRR